MGAQMSSMALCALTLLAAACGSDDNGSKVAFNCCLIQRYCTECTRIVHSFDPSIEVCTANEEALANGSNDQACASEVESHANNAGYYRCASSTEKYDLTKARVDCSK